MSPPISFEEAERICAIEPIHQLGRSQSHGALLVCDLEGCVVRYCSRNIAIVFGVEPEHVIEQPLKALHAALPKLAEDLFASETWPDGTPRRAKGRLSINDAGLSFDVSMHVWDKHLVAEFLPVESGPRDFESEPTTLIEGITYRLSFANDVLELCSVACAEVQRLTGYRRVMAYRFDPDWHGEVIAESVRHGENIAFLGLHFPASDIPPQARELYRSVHLRVIADANDEGTPIVGKAGAPATPDLSHALIRSVSAMHLQYLRNMEVQATVAISLLVDGRLWGLLVAHDDAPRIPPQHVVHALRTVCRILGQLVSAHLLGLEFRKQQENDQALLDLVERIQSIAAGSQGVPAIWNALRGDVRSWFEADAAVLLHDGKICDAPPQEYSAICRWIEHFQALHSNEPLPTYSLAKDGLASDGSLFSGALWIPVGISGYGILLLRESAPKEVFWGGDPSKPMEEDVHGARLAPRRSFEKWRELRSNESIHWAPAKIEGARRLAAQWRLVVLGEEKRKADETIRLLESGLLRIHDGFMIAKHSEEGAISVAFSNPLFDALFNQGNPSAGSLPKFLDSNVVDAAASEAIQKAIAAGEASSFEFQTRDRRWVELGLSPAKVSAAEQPYWAAIAREITDRKREEQTRQAQAQLLSETNDRYRRILETSHEGIATVDDKGIIDFCNQRMMDIVGEESSLVGNRIQTLLSRGGVVETLLAADASTALDERREVDLRHASGRLVSCELAWIPLRKEEHQRSGWLVMVRDTSEERTLQNSLLLLNANLEATVAERTVELVTAKEAADSANRAKSEFLANMSHELRSPLHGILGFTRLLIEDEALPGDRTARYLKKVEKNASNLLDLVNDLLDSSKIETRNFTIQPTRCDLAELCRSVVGEFQVESTPTSPIQIDGPTNAPCTGDPFRLSQVMRNLLANAVRYSPTNSSIVLQISQTEGGWWQLCVKDRGPGIPPDELESVFDRFVQSSSTKTGAGGTGLGLHIARGIIEAHGGWIQASNREGGGAVFAVFLPVNA